MDSAHQNDTILCPVCGGWGVSPPFSVHKCSKCTGIGVKIFKSGVEYFFRAPSFVDHGKRENSKKLLIATISFSVMVILILITLSVVLTK